MPTVSVIMPAYNAEAYMPAAIESVLHQTLPDLELLVVDDGSSDRSVELARSYASRDSRVRVLTQPNAGPGPARNAAFRVAKGRLFAFLDSDDEWDDGFLNEQVAVLNNRPDADVVIGNARNRGGPHPSQPSRPPAGSVRPISLADMLADEEVLFIMAVFRREVVEAVGGFDPAFFTNEEYEMWIRAAIAGFRFVRNPKPLGWYRCRHDSLSSSDTRMLKGILGVFDKTRGALPPDSLERAILERQVSRFEAELSAAEARASLARGDARSAARHLADLHARRGGLKVGAALGVLNHIPALALMLFRLRQRLLGRAEPQPHAAGGANTPPALGAYGLGRR